MLKYLELFLGLHREAKTLPAGAAARTAGGGLTVSRWWNRDGFSKAR